MADEITLKILERVTSGPLPINTSEAKEIAPLSRIKELADSGFIEGAIVPGEKGEIVKVRISGITQPGRSILSKMRETNKTKSPTAKSLRFLERIFWILAGVGATLLGLWLAKILGL